MSDNLFANLPAVGAADEQFTTLLAERELEVRRIVSTGQASPPGFWYEQPEAEWVLLVSGEALLRFEDEPEPRRLLPGSYIDIAPRRRHRVDWTAPNRQTVWLAIHRPAL
ncbi:MAG: cupin [Azonexus sp.]|mgnify:CR=1 FL=1|jgi:cupin 2 domain-containing protein|nr:cupin [Azonexus sp.]